MASSNPSPSVAPVRVMLWSNPRSLSTVFIKSMSQLDDIQILFELYESAYKFGPERNNKAYLKNACEEMYKNGSETHALQPRVHLYDDDVCTYKWVQDTMESDFPGKKVIFAKDQGYGLNGNYSLLPSGFQHIFLIRHPKKCFESWRKTWEKMLQTSMSYDSARSNQYQSLYELMEYTQLHGQPNPIVIDADDLQRHPESILRQYCEATNIPYNPSLLEWDAGNDLLYTMGATKKMILNGLVSEGGGFFADAFNSTKFNPPSTDPSSITDIPDHLLQATMKYYNKMYELRIKP